MKKQTSIDKRLEHQPWRTTQRENRDDYEQRATAAKWAKILGAIVRAQNFSMVGTSPSNLAISMDAKLSPAQVEYHLKEMVKAGLLTIRGNGLRRTLDLSATAKVAGPDVLVRAIKPKKMEEVTTMDTKEFKQGPKKEREDFFTLAQKIAREIIDQTYAKGQPPLMKEIYKPLGYTYPSACNAVIRKMVERGWLSHRKSRHNDLRVTGLGRSVLLNGAGVDEPAPMPVTQTRKAGPPPRVVRNEAEDMPTGAPTWRAYTPPAEAQAAPAQTTADLSDLDTLDLVFELQSRGLKVSR